MKPRQSVVLVLSMLFSCAVGAAAEQAKTGSFYKSPPLFSTAPSETASLQTITRFGPVGIGIDLVQPAFTMQIRNVEDGSPAAAAGKLKKGQIIETINGQKLADIDPRIQLGNIITDAEATDGVVKLVVKDAPTAAPQEVVVKIPVLGSYSKTWPLDCPKSDKIVRNYADYLAKPDSNKGFSGIGMLFLLSTGEDKDLAPVRQWVHGMIGKPAPTYAWHLGYGGIPLTEYYLRTGDAAALPIIQKWVESAAKAEYLDAWAGRGGVTHISYGNGHLNAGGTAVVTFLQLAKECGANVDESLLRRTLVHFFRYAGRGNNPYGDDRPETSFVDNGKNGNLAFAMAAAASLTPDGEQSIYARARDTAAMTGFYTTTFMLHGHTGGGIGEGCAAPRWGCCTRRSRSSTASSWTTGGGTTSCPAASTAPSASSAGTRLRGIYDSEEWGAALRAHLHDPAQDAADHRGAVEVRQALPAARAALGHRGRRGVPHARARSRQGRQATGPLPGDAGDGFLQAADRTAAGDGRRGRRRAATLHPPSGCPGPPARGEQRAWASSSTTCGSSPAPGSGPRSSTSGSAIRTRGSGGPHSRRWPGSCLPTRWSNSCRRRYSASRSAC